MNMNRAVIPQFKEGDFVRLRVAGRAAHVHPGLEADGEGARVLARVPSGALGRVVRVRDYPSPFPYIVEFGHVVIGVPELDLERSSPRRRQRQRVRGWRLPPGGVIVDRTSKFGNPYTIWDSGSREEAVRRHREALMEGRLTFRGHRITVEMVREALAGRDLFCACREGEACHGDTLLAVANALEGVNGSDQGC